MQYERFAIEPSRQRPCPAHRAAARCSAAVALRSGAALVVRVQIVPSASGAASPAACAPVTGRR